MNKRKKITKEQSPTMHERMSKGTWLGNGRVWKMGDGREINTNMIVAERDVVALILIQVP